MKKKKYLQLLKTLAEHLGYVIFIAAACTITIEAIVHWPTTLEVLGKLLNIITPFILGFFIAYLIRPLVNLIVRGLDLIKKGKFLKLKKILGIVFAYIICLGGLAIVIIYIHPQIVESIKTAGQTIQDGYQYLTTNTDQINNILPFVNLTEVLSYTKDNLIDKLFNYSGTIIPYVYEWSSSFIGLIYNIIMGIVISVYMVADSDRLVKGLKKIVFALTPKKKSRKVWGILEQCNHIFNGFIFGKAVDSLIIGILCFILMSIFQFKYAILISVIVGITNMIPYFGPFIGAIPGVLIYLFIDPKMAIMFAIMILALQQFDGIYLGPKILGDLTGIKPLWVIFGITVGGAYFGVLGMFLGVPTVAVLMYLMDLFINKKMQDKKISVEDLNE